MEEVRVHVTRIHTLPIACGICESRFKSIEDMHDHQQVQHLDLLCHKCNFCEKRFSLESSLKFHKRMSHPFPDEGITCNVCGKFCKTKNNLRQHLEFNHVDPSKFLLCPTCGIQVKNNKALKSHMLNHAPRIFVCQTCGFDTVSENFLMKHIMRVHNNTERPHKCSHCPLTFKNKVQLKSHMNRHLGKNIKACQYCGIEKSTKDLYNHIVIVHKGRKYKCSECSAMFSLRAHLKNHFTLKHPDVTIPANADLEVIYTKIPEVTSTPAPPSAKRSRVPRIDNPKSRVSERPPGAISCEKCPRAVFHTRDDLELHLLRHERDPEYRMRHRLPVQRLGQSPPPVVAAAADPDSVGAFPPPPQAESAIEQPTQTDDLPITMFPLQSSGGFDNTNQYNSYPNINVNPFLQLHQPVMHSYSYGNFPNFDPTMFNK